MNFWDEYNGREDVGQAYSQDDLHSYFNQPKKPPQKKKKSFWLDQVSTAGGILGGIGGSFVAPIAGTAGGAAVGSALGEAIENAISGESLTKNVAKEAALGGVFGASPIKVAKAGIGAVTGGISKGVSEQATRSALQRGAQNQLGHAWGLKTGAKVGSDVLTPQRARDLQHFIAKDVGVPKSANADMVAERLVNYKQLTGKNIDDIIKSADRSLSPQETNQLLERVGSKIGSLAGVDTASPIAQRLTQQLGEKKSISELIQFRRSLDDAVNFARNPNSPDPITERLAKTMRGEIDTITSKLVPGLKVSNGQYSKASHALDYVLPAAKSPGGVNILNNKIAGGITQRGRAAVGQLGNIGKNSAPVTTTKRGIVGRLGAVGALQGAGQQAPASNNLEDALMEQSMYGDQAGLNGMQDQPVSGSPYSKENLMADIQRDPENAKDYIAYYASLDEIFNPQGAAQKPLSTEAAKSVSNAEIGLSALGDFQNEITRDPSVLAKRNIPGRGLLGGVLGNALGTRGADAAAGQIVDVIARLRTGAAITADEAKRFEQFIPTSGDPENVRQQKLNYLRNQFQMVAQRGQQGGGSLEDALMQYGSGY